MIKGIGTDILSIQRIENILEADHDLFIKKVYTQNQVNQAQNRKNRTAFLADRFAGKEAVFRCLGVSGNCVRLNEIEILADEQGKPNVTLYHNAKKIADEKGISSIVISLSYETDYVVAFATAE